MPLIPSLLLDQSNQLYFPISEFQRQDKLKSSFQWKGEPGNSKGRLVFPEGTVIEGEFNNFKMLSGIIKYPSGAYLKGRFNESKFSKIGFFAEGEFVTSNKEVLKLKLDGLSIVDAIFYNTEGKLIYTYKGSDVSVHVGKRFIKFGSFGVFEGLVDKKTDIIKGNIYSYFGPYLTPTIYHQEKKNSFFKKYDSVICESNRGLSFDVDDLNDFEDQKNKELLTFEFYCFVGKFFFFTEKKDDPKTATGFYKNSLMKMGLNMIIIEKQIHFIFESDLYTVKQLKKLIMRICFELHNKNLVNKKFPIWDLNKEKQKKKGCVNLLKENFKEQKEKYQKIIKCYEEKMKEQNVTIQEMNDRNDVLEEKCNEFDKELDRVLNERVEEQHKNEHLKKDIDNLIKQNDKLFQKELQLLNSNEELKLQDLKNVKTIMQLQQKLEEKDSAMRSLEMYSNSLGEDIREKNTENKEIIIKQTEMKEDIESLTNKLENERAKNECLIAELKDLDFTFEKQKNKLQKNENLKNKIEELEEDLVVVKKQKDEFEEECFTLAEQLHKSSLGQKEESTNYVKEIASLKKELCQIKLREKSYREKDKTIRQLTDENSKLKQGNDFLENKTLEYKGKIASLTDRINDYSNRIKNQSTVIASKEEENKMNRESIQFLKRNIEELVQMESEMKSQNIKIENEMSELTKANAKLLSSLDEVVTKTKKTDSKLVKEVERSRMFEQEINHLNKINEKANMKITKLQEKIERLGAAIDKTVIEKMVLEEKMFEKTKEQKLLEKENKIIREEQEKNQDSLKQCQELISLDYFKGELVKGKKNGICSEKKQDYEFKGNFKDNIKSGKGKLIIGDIEQEGEFKDNKLNGKGLHINKKSNTRIEGEFKEGIFVGDELRIGKVIYNGHIVDNKMSGKGYFQFSNKLAFEGSFEDDKIVDATEGIVFNITEGIEKVVNVVGDFLYTEDLKEKFNINFETGELEKSE